MSALEEVNARIRELRRNYRKRLRKLTHRRGQLLIAAAELKALEQLGIVRPELTRSEAHRAGLPLALAAALEIQETGGGANVWGHDPVLCGPVGGNVTASNYASYKRGRPKCGMQGAGGLQLTYYTIQDEADRLGGCWKPKYNYRVGMHHLAAEIDAHGKTDGLSIYNAGTANSTAGQAYARSVEAHEDRCRAKLAAARKGATK